MTAGARKLRFGLANLTRQLNAEPDARGRQKAFDSLLLKLDRFVAGGDPSKPSAAEVARFRDALLPVLKNRSYIADFAALARKQGVPGGKLLHIPLAGDVIVVPALDLPRISRFVAVGEGRRYGMDDAEVLTTALANLERRAKSFELHAIGPVRTLNFDPPDYNVSLLLPNSWQDIPDLPKNVVIALPARDVLAFADGDDPKSMTALRRIAAMKDGGFPVSRLLFRLTPKGLEALR